MEALKINTVNASKSKSKSKAGRKPARKLKSKLSNGDKARAAAFFALAICGLGVSLPHLADEIGQLTGTTLLAAWLVSIVIDCGMVATKAHLSADGPKTVVAWTVLGACTLVSIVLNCHAFASHSRGTFGMVASIGFGIFLPLFNLALSYLGSAILLGHKD